MTLIEKEFYSNVTESIRNYAEENQVVTGFLLATFQRQVASCPAATFKNWTNKNFESTEDINEDITEKEKIIWKDEKTSNKWKEENISELLERMTGWQLDAFKESYDHKVKTGLSIFKKNQIKK